MVKVAIQKFVWGLGIAYSETFTLSKEELEFFKELIARYSKVVVSKYPPIIEEYRLIVLD